MTEYAIRTDVKGQLYESLISYLCCCASQFQIVVRHDCALDALMSNGVELLADLSPYSLGSSEEESWPGTQLLDGSATIHRFRVTELAIPILLRPKSLFNWCQPEFPEDPAFFRADSSLVLTTISHEHYAFLQTTHEELLLLRKYLPELLEK